MKQLPIVRRHTFSALHYLALPERKRTPPQAIQGASLIEILITLLILAFGLIGLIGLQTQSLKQTSDTSLQSQATWMAHEIAERMRANNSNLSFYELSNFAPSSCTANPSKNCQLTSTSTCTAEEVADYDVWDIFCESATDTRALPLSSVNIAEDTANASVYIITMNWRSRSIFGDATTTTPTQSLSLRVRP